MFQEKKEDGGVERVGLHLNTPAFALRLAFLLVQRLRL